MGISFAPYIANLVMVTLLQELIPSLPFNVPFVKKYINNLILAVPNNKTNETLILFNRYNPKIQFTIELVHREIAFLDILLVHEMDHTISPKWYRKPTASSRYISYLSEHPRYQKFNIANNLKNRALKLTSQQYQSTAIQQVKSLLTIYNYPKVVINKIMHNRSHAKSASNNITTRYFTIPHITGLSYQLQKMLNVQFNITVTPVVINPVQCCHIWRNLMLIGVLGKKSFMLGFSKILVNIYKFTELHFILYVKC